MPEGDRPQGEQPTQQGRAVPRAPRGSGHTTPLPQRLYRVSRAGLHLIEGVGVTALLFPFFDAERRRAYAHGWSRRLLRMLRVNLRVHGLPAEGLPGNLLVVANHVSWLDIFVLNTVQPARFIAKAELKRWPLVGRFASGGGTIFVDRSRRHDTHQVNRHATSVLAAGDVIAIFPEGTTTDGRDVLPFHGSLLQPIVDAAGHVLPVAIRYLAPDGEASDAAAYVGEMSFARSFWRVTGEHRLHVDVRLANLLAAKDRHRRELSREAETVIRAVLASPAGGSEPGRRDDRPA